MSRNYDNWEELTEAAQQRCKRILDKEVAPIAKEIVRKHIQSDIYDAYTPLPDGWVDSRGRPSTYKRRYLWFKRGSIYHSFLSQDEILITSNANASPAIVKGWSFRNRYPGAFLKMIETGNMGIWSHGFPRPAIHNAQTEIDKSRRIEQAINNALNR